MTPWDEVPLTPDLEPKAEEMALALRDAGLYEDGHQWQQANGSYVLMMDLFIGDVAYTARVQEPVQHDFDAAFREIAAEATRERFEAAREQMLRDGHL